MQVVKPYIVVVEDESDLLDLITYNLTRNGYEVTGLTSGEQALQIILHKKPDLVLLDLMLPGVGGLELCRLLKANPETAEIPLIMVTALGEPKDVVRGLEVGADDYITKPFDTTVLLARIRTVLRRQEPAKTDESPRSPDAVINLLRQVEGGLLSKIYDIRE